MAPSRSDDCILGSSSSPSSVSSLSTPVSSNGDAPSSIRRDSERPWHLPKANHNESEPPTTPANFSTANPKRSKTASSAATREATRKRRSAQFGRQIDNRKTTEDNGEQRKQNGHMLFRADKPPYSKAPSAPGVPPTVNDHKQQQTNKKTEFLRTTTNKNDHTLKNWLILSLFVVGLIICAFSLACLLLLPHFVSQQISRKLVLKNGSMLLERWSKPNVPMYFKVWLFNVKNAHELVAGRGTKPQVEEIGPFVFNLKRQKDVISFAGDNLYYTERKIYKFNRELSCCAINTSVTIPNIPLVAVVDRALSYQLPLFGRIVPRLINRAIQSLREPMFVRKQAREILFDGYDVELLKMVSRIGSLVGLPKQSQSFGILKGRNDTWRPEQDGVWAINTGQRERNLFGRVTSWNSYRRLPFWSAPQCNVINGSDGTLFPPPIRRTEPLYIFNQELCRTVNLVFDRPSDIRSIQAYRFVLNPMNFAHTVSPSASGLPLTMTTTSSLANGAAIATVRALPKNQAADGRINSLEARASEQRGAFAAAQENQQPALASLHTREQEKLVLEAQRLAKERHKQSETPMNPQKCFCDRKTTNLNGVNVCEFDGLIDLSKCSKQAQVIFGSMPHFYNSDPRLLSHVDGMRPNSSKHTTFLDIEPNTGLVLGGKRRVQLNLIVKRNNEIDGFENINDMLVPIVWFEESAQIPEEAAQKFKSLYTDRVRLINVSLLVLFIASLLLLAIDFRIMIKSRHWYRFKLVTANALSNLHQRQQNAPGRFRQSGGGGAAIAAGARAPAQQLDTSSSESDRSDTEQSATQSSRYKDSTASSRVLASSMNSVIDKQQQQQQQRKPSSVGLLSVTSSNAPQENESSDVWPANNKDP